MTPDGTRPVTSLTAGKAPVPLTLSRVAQDTSFALFIFLSSFGDGPSLKKDYPLSAAKCIMHLLKRLSPFGEL